MNREAFEEVVSRSGYRRDFIASKLGVSRSVFAQKCNGVIQWKLKELQIMCDLLNISPDEIINIFFDQKSTNI